MEKSNQHFHDCSVIGKLKYLGKSNWPDIAYAVHKCVLFSKDPRKPHGGAVKRIVHYLKGTDKRGIYIRCRDSDFKVWVDSHFSGIWFPEEAKDDLDAAHSC